MVDPKELDFDRIATLTKREIKVPGGETMTIAVDKEAGMYYEFDQYGTLTNAERIDSVGGNADMVKEYDLRSGISTQFDTNTEQPAQVQKKACINKFRFSTGAFILGAIFGLLLIIIMFFAVNFSSVEEAMRWISSL